MKKRRPGIPDGIVGVTIYILVFGLLNFVSSNYNGLNGGTGAYSFYRGPVLPMTSLSGGEVLEAERNVNFDFSLLSSDTMSIIRGQQARITDDYLLTNPTDETVTVRLAYPFEGAAARGPEEIPAIRVDGQEVEAPIAVPTDIDKTLNRANSWEDYEELLTQTDFLPEAIAEPPVLDAPIKVYRFANITHTEDAPYVFLRVRFQKPENCKIWAFNWKAGGWDARNGEFDMMFQATPEGTGEGYLLVSGGELPEFRLDGNLGYNEGEQYETDNVTCQVEVFESTLGEMVRRCAEKYDAWQEEGEPLHDLVTPELLCAGAMKQLATGAYSDKANGYISLDSVFYSAASQNRLNYRIFDVELAPGETVKVSVQYRKESSEDNGGFQERRYGFDLATRLASNLQFTAQTASISGYDRIEIQSQNFGFDPDQNITRVPLELTEERYYIDVVMKE